MKFKLLFILFNGILGLSFLLLFLLPLPILGWTALVSFWLNNWYIALAFLLVLSVLDGYFIKNWKMFRLLEREDWAGLYDYLEREKNAQGFLGPARTKLYVNACLILQKPASIDLLRVGYLEKRIKISRSVALLLGLPLILAGRSAEIKAFLGPILARAPKSAQAGWLTWALAFAKLIDQEWESAKEDLFTLVGDTRQPLLQLLSLYLLENLRTRDDEVPKVLDPLAIDLKRRMSDAEWHRHIEGMKEQVVLVLFMNQLIADAKRWLANFEPH